MLSIKRGPPVESNRVKLGRLRRSLKHEKVIWSDHRHFADLYVRTVDNAKFDISPTEIDFIVKVVRPMNLNEADADE